MTADGTDRRAAGKHLMERHDEPGPDVAATVERLTELEAACFDQPWTAVSLVGELAGAQSRVVEMTPAQGGRTAGYACWWLVGGRAELQRICVRPRARGGGLGRELLSYVLEQARTDGLNGVSLEVRASNEPAHRLYASLGFVESGRRRAYYPGGDDAILMDLDF